MSDDTSAAGAESPTWLDTAMVQEALRRGGEENLRVTSVAVRPATAPGDNYGSALFRARAALADGDARSVVVKTLPPGAATAKTIVELGTFERESAALSRAIPQMEGLLEAAAPGGHSPLAPRCLLHRCGPEFFIVMEDLAPQGFRCADRHRGLGLRHCLLALRALASFHAASAALLRRDPALADAFTNPWSIPHSAYANLIDWTFQSAVDACRDAPGMEDVARSLEAFKPNALKVLSEVRNATPGDFNVLVHGDFWINNMMFQYEDGHPRSVRFVDLQTAQVGSPALDLLYFLNTSPSEDVSTHHEDLLVLEYHKALSDAAELLAVEAPSLGELRAQMDAKGAFALQGAICALPGVKARRAVEVDGAIGEGEGTGADAADIFRQDDVQRWWRRLLPEFRRKGWLPA